MNFSNAKKTTHKSCNNNITILFSSKTICLRSTNAKEKLKKQNLTVITSMLVGGTMMQMFVRA